MYGWGTTVTHKKFENVWFKLNNIAVILGEQQ
jgi:hypothetical protein